MALRQRKLGDLLPDDPYGISVSLPAWQDVLGWVSRDPAVISKMKSGYPRFFIPPAVQKLGSTLLERAKFLVPSAQICQPNLSALLIDSFQSAHDCQRYLQRCGSSKSVVLHATLSGSIQLLPRCECFTTSNANYEELYLVTFTEELAAEAKAFWQHTGSGISTRWAVHWLENTYNEPSKIPVEETVTATAKLHERIASLFTTDSVVVVPDDVILYPSGMSAITQSAKAICNWRNRDTIRVALFGFLYVDTLKVLNKIYAFECIPYETVSASSFAALEKDLQNGLEIDALYTEFPTNPLLDCPDISRLRELATQYGFLLVVDDTVGTAVNLDLLPWCDIICTSLTKMFSGGCDVMGGSTVINSKSSAYSGIRKAFAMQSCEPYFPLDILVMEKNSRDMASRVRKASANAEKLVSILRSHSAVSEVHYPKGSSAQEFYDKFRRPNAGYGFLFSIIFKTPAAAIAFYNALDLAKGPSLGTNFTLSSPHTLMGHYKEMEWAAKFGVLEHLVRISVGIEDLDLLKKVIFDACEHAKWACSPN